MDLEMTAQSAVEAINVVEQFPNFSGGQFTADGKLDCEIEHPEFGWIPTTLDRAEGEGFFDLVAASGGVADYVADPDADRADQRGAAMDRVNWLHADFLRNLTGGATVEERDTWQTKEAAARAMVAGSVTDGQKAMIGFEAAGAGVDPIALAQTIIAKADSFQTLVGMAAGLRAKAKAAIVLAAGESVPIDDVAGAIDAVFAQVSIEVEAAVAAWKGLENGA
jgi:hypothetical protein